MNSDPATFITADCFFHLPGVPLSPGILAEFDRFHVGQQALDLQTQRGIAVVNAWVKKSTRGEIKARLDKPFADPTDAALNALLFRAKWEVPFDAKATADADFHTADGGRGRVKLMHQLGTLAVRRSPGFVGVELPFAGGRYAMTIITTTDRPSPLARFAGVCDWLSGEMFREEPIKLSMPRFRLDTSASLLPALQNDLGMAIASPSAFEGFGPLLGSTASCSEPWSISTRKA